MKDAPTILENGLEIHFIQELYGNNNEILDIYELRKNFSRGRTKTLKRVDVPQGTDITLVRAHLQARMHKAPGGFRRFSDALDISKLILPLALERFAVNARKENRPEAEQAHTIKFQGDPLVQLAVMELGESEVRSISFRNSLCEYRPTELEAYKSELISGLVDSYSADTSKSYLRQYVDHKFGSDLGL